MSPRVTSLVPSFALLSPQLAVLAENLKMFVQLLHFVLSENLLSSKYLRPNKTHRQDHQTSFLLSFLILVHFTNCSGAVLRNLGAAVVSEQYQGWKSRSEEDEGRSVKMVTNLVQKQPNQRNVRRNLLLKQS